MSKDAGQHYRYKAVIIVTKEDAERGYVHFNVDPFRIARIYKMNCFALVTILKKTLCAGNRGHKSKMQDLEDIICAAKREIEMIIEDKKFEKVMDIQLTIKSRT